MSLTRQATASTAAARRAPIHFTAARTQITPRPSNSSPTDTDDQPPPYEVAITGPPFQESPSVLYIRDYHQQHQAQFHQQTPQPQYFPHQEHMPQLSQHAVGQGSSVSPTQYLSAPTNPWAVEATQMYSGNILASHEQQYSSFPFYSIASPQITLPSLYMYPVYVLSPLEAGEMTAGQSWESMRETEVEASEHPVADDPVVRNKNYRRKRRSGIEIRVPSWITEKFYGL